MGLLYDLFIYSWVTSVQSILVHTCSSTGGIYILNEADFFLFHVDIKCQNQ